VSSSSSSRRGGCSSCRSCSSCAWLLLVTAQRAVLAKSAGEVCAGDGTLLLACVPQQWSVPSVVSVVRAERGTLLGEGTLQPTLAGTVSDSPCVSSCHSGCF
jgi:hypothetical protein